MKPKDKKTLNELVKKQNEEIRKHPLFSVMSPYIRSQKSQFANVDVLKKMALAHVPCPEPVMIIFMDFDAEVFQKLSGDPLRPTVYYIQEENGSVSLVRQMNCDLSQVYFRFRSATKDDFSALGWNQNMGIGFIESIKFMNYFVESFGGGFQDVVHFVFSKVPQKRRMDELHPQASAHWKTEYHPYRRLVITELSKDKKIS